MLHELATHAMKCGALSNDTGRILVSWAVKPTAIGRAVVICWKEIGGPAATAPLRQGFGTELIRRQVERGLRGRIVTRFTPEGFHAQMTLPLDVEPRIISAE